MVNRQFLCQMGIYVAQKLRDTAVSRGKGTDKSGFGVLDTAGYRDK